MDGRNRILRPRTQLDQGPVSQPQGWQGFDPMAARTLDPVRTFETPLVYFPADINIPVLTNVSIQLPPRCSQIAFINLVPNVMASFNNGGFRTIKDGFVMNGEFTSLQVQTDAAGLCTIQLGCY